MRASPCGVPQGPETLPRPTVQGPESCLGHWRGSANLVVACDPEFQVWGHLLGTRGGASSKSCLQPGPQGHGLGPRLGHGQEGLVLGRWVVRRVVATSGLLGGRQLPSLRGAAGRWQPPGPRAPGTRLVSGGHSELGRGELWGGHSQPWKVLEDCGFAPVWGQAPVGSRAWGRGSLESLSIALSPGGASRGWGPTGWYGASPGSWDSGSTETGQPAEGGNLPRSRRGACRRGSLAAAVLAAGGPGRGLGGWCEGFPRKSLRLPRGSTPPHRAWGLRGTRGTLPPGTVPW